jgi:hypothetical protein
MRVFMITGLLVGALLGCGKKEAPEEAGRVRIEKPAPEKKAPPTKKEEPGVETPKAEDRAGAEDVDQAVTALLDYQPKPSGQREALWPLQWGIVARGKDALPALGKALEGKLGKKRREWLEHARQALESLDKAVESASFIVTARCTKVTYGTEDYEGDDFGGELTFIEVEFEPMETIKGEARKGIIKWFVGQEIPGSVSKEKAMLGDISVSVIKKGTELILFLNPSGKVVMPFPALGPIPKTDGMVARVKECLRD